MVTLDRSVAGAAHAEDRLRHDQMIWLTTVRADGQAQTSAVWFHWDGNDFLVVTQPRSPKIRNIEANPRVSVNLNGASYGTGLVVVEGTAEVVPGYASGPWPDPARVEAYYAKYQRVLRDELRSSAAEMAAAFSTALRITPTHWRVTP